VFGVKICKLVKVLTFLCFVTLCLQDTAPCRFRAGFRAGQVTGVRVGERRKNFAENCKLGKILTFLCFRWRNPGVNQALL